MDEIWKEIQGYEWLYEVSNLGNVRSVERDVWDSRNGIRRRKSVLLKQYTGVNGYMRVGLSRDAVLKTFLVHRLVGFAFIENPNNYPQINHKDFNRSNNHVSNLEWVTSKMNVYHASGDGDTTPILLRRVIDPKIEEVMNLYNELKAADKK